MQSPTFPPLQERVLALAVNIVLFYSAYVLASGRFALGGDIQSVWLFAAIALWILSLLTAPWFIPPRDSLANAISAGLVLVVLDLSLVPAFRQQLQLLRWIAAAYCLALVLLSLSALLLNAQKNMEPTSRFLYRLSNTFGRGEILYTPPIMISIIGGYSHSLETIAWLSIAWVFAATARPIERLLAIYREWNAEARQVSGTALGIIDRVDHPNIVRVRLSSGAAWKPGRLCVAAMPDGDQQFVLSLFAQVQGAEVIGTGMCVSVVADRLPLSVGLVRAMHDEEKTKEFMDALSGTKGAELVGFTVENSTIGLLLFEISASTDLFEGTVVFARIGGQSVYYQVLDAETTEESFDANPRGTHIARAAQLGCYSAAAGFTKYTWLPAMNAPVFSASHLSFQEPVAADGEIEIGTVPNTNIRVAARLHELVDHHAAILGVTGTGKTELALDIARRASENGIKVFCVDFTGEYRQRLADLQPEFPAPTHAQASELDDLLFAADTGEYGAKKEKAILKKAVDELRDQTQAQVSGFLMDQSRYLSIFELSEISNTKATLRLTELYLSSIMQWARDNRGLQRTLIVLEEAHTIVPEVFGSGFDHDTQWVVNRIGQIALQGRKYGVGLLVVTQRTALVSKTILSQCNTFFTHALIDHTSLSFLESVYSAQHARTIPNLGRFEFLAFGKALKAERPILLKRPFDPAKKAASEALQ